MKYWENEDGTIVLTQTEYGPDVKGDYTIDCGKKEKAEVEAALKRAGLRIGK